MKKLVMLALTAGLIASSLAPPALAGKKAKPVKTTLFMHGVQPLGELDGLQWLADGAGGTSPMTLDTKEPAGAAPKSMTFANPLLNDQCTGLPIAFPTFNGPLAGTIVGDATMTLHFASAPAAVTARLWADVPVFNCNDGYIEPASEVVVDVPPGQNAVEVTFPKLKLKAQSFVMIEILTPSAPDYRGQVGRLLYDSTSAPSQITFKCIPSKGKACA